MSVERFDSKSFRNFLGTPVLEDDKSWGKLEQYAIDSTKLATYEQQLRSTFLQHHSSFDYEQEISSVGFPQTAQVLRRIRTGLPNQHKTQMGHFAEVLGSEYGRWVLEFDTTFVFPKHFNPNPDQSMKGIDILGVDSLIHPSALMIGEAKCYKEFDKRTINESHSHLFSLWNGSSSRSLAFYLEILRLEKKASGIDRIYYGGLSGVRQRALIFSISGNKPQSPFESLDVLCSKSPLPNLVAVHIQVEALRDIDSTSSNETWLSSLFQAEES
jgi:hypothetical protein